MSAAYGKSRAFKGVLRSLAMWWPLREGTGNPADIYGGLTTTLAGDAAWTTDGGMPAIDLDGTGDYIQAAAAALIDTVIGSTAWTFSGWARPDSDSTQMGIFTVDKDSTLVQFYFNATAKLQVFARDAEADSISFSTATSYTSGVWGHFVLVRDGTSMYVYQNGTIDATSGANASLGAIDLASENLYFGNLISGADTKVNYLNGALSDLRFYSRALSGPEIMQNYKAGRF